MRDSLKALCSFPCKLGREDVRFYVRRSKIVSMVLPQVPYPFPPNYSLDIEFLGEAGIDAGGLTTDFFKQVLSPLQWCIAG